MQGVSWGTGTVPGNGIRHWAITPPLPGGQESMTVRLRVGIVHVLIIQES